MNDKQRKKRDRSHLYLAPFVFLFYLAFDFKMFLGAGIGYIVGYILAEHVYKIPANIKDSEREVKNNDE